MTTRLTGGRVRLLVPLALAAGIALVLAFQGQASVETAATATEQR